MPEAQIKQINLEGEAGYSEEKELITLLGELSNLDVPEILSNEFVSIGEEGSGVMYTDKENNNVLIARPGEDAEILHIHLLFESENIEIFESILGDIVDIVGNLDVTSFVVNFDLDADFNELSLPIESTDNYDVKGIRISEEEVDYIIQESDDSTSVSASKEDILDEGLEEDYIEQNLAEMKAFIQRLPG